MGGNVWALAACLIAVAGSGCVGEADRSPPADGTPERDSPRGAAALRDDPPGPAKFAEPTRMAEPWAVAFEERLEGHGVVDGQPTGACPTINWAIGNWTGCWFLRVYELRGAPLTGDVTLTWTAGGADTEQLFLQTGPVRRTERSVGDSSYGYEFAAEAAAGRGASPLRHTWNGTGQPGEPALVGILVTYAYLPGSTAVFLPQTFQVEANLTLLVVPGAA